MTVDPVEVELANRCEARRRDYVALVRQHADGLAVDAVKTADALERVSRTKADFDSDAFAIAEEAEVQREVLSDDQLDELRRQMEKRQREVDAEAMRVALDAVKGLDHPNLYKLLGLLVAVVPHTVTRELSSRRVNLALAHESTVTVNNERRKRIARLHAEHAFVFSSNSRAH